MAGKMKIRKFRLLLTMSVIAGVIFSIDSFRRDLFHSPTSSGVKIEGEFSKNRKDKSDNDKDIEVVANEDLRAVTEETSENIDDVEYLGSSEKSVPSEQLGLGEFAVSGLGDTVSTPYSQDLVFAENFGSPYYSCADMDLWLCRDTLEAFNQMMYDYNSSTSASDIVVYGTHNSNVSDSPCPEFFEENAGGYNIDIAVNTKNGISTFDGEGNSSWILKHCVEYGFIVRYPKNKQDVTGHDFCKWHLRYVGRVHATLMYDKKLSIEEYIDFIKNYSFDSPFTYQTGNEIYKMYYVPYEENTTRVRVPINGNYSISGDNSEGFIVTTYSKY